MSKKDAIEFAYVMLKKKDLSWDWPPGGLCSYCLNRKEEGHSEGCQFAQALKSLDPGGIIVKEDVADNMW